MSFAFLLGMILVFGAQAVMAQQGDLPSVMELQMAYADQNGGRANIEAFHSLIVTGVITDAEGEKVGFRLFKKRPNLIRMQLNFPSGRKETVFDGERGFQVVANDGMETQVLDLSPAETAQLIGDSTLEGPFYRLRARPERLEVVAEVEVEGQPAYEIEIGEEADSPYERIWLSKEHVQEVKLRRKLESPEGESLREEIYFSNFERVRGLWLAKTARYMRGADFRQTVQIEQIRANVGIFDSYFKRPEL